MPDARRFWWLDEVVRQRAYQAARRAVQRSANMVLAEGNRLMMTSGPGGVEYKRNRPIRAHVASLPGHPPATDTGYLIASGAVVLKGTVAYAEWAAEYASFLELGTRNIAPRPFARPALDAVAGSGGLQRDVQAELQVEFGGNVRVVATTTAGLAAP